MRDHGALAAAFDRAQERWGRVVDVVWNNAGVEWFGPLVLSAENQYRRVFDVNVLGVLHGTMLGLERLPDGGAIIQTASVAGLSGVPMQALYAASKAAVISITKTAAIEGVTDPSMTGAPPAVPERGADPARSRRPLVRRGTGTIDPIPA